MREDQIVPSEDLIPVENSLLKEENDAEVSRSTVDYGDLYYLVVEAARPPPPPEKPPPMKYKELPLYKSPHYEYKDYIEDKTKCPMANTKMIHEWLHPHVKSFRKSFQRLCKDFCSEFCSMKKELKSTIREKKNSFKKKMRDPNNLQMRQAVVALGGLTGYYIASTKGIPSKLFFVGLGLSAAGALCFPKETDETFRTFLYHAGKTVISVYNRYCDKNFRLRERLPCKDDLPPPPKYRKQNVCPKK